MVIFSRFMLPRIALVLTFDILGKTLLVVLGVQVHTYNRFRK